MTKTLSIKGMSCQNCVHHVTEALNAVDGIGEVKVNLEENNAVVESGAVSDDALKQAVDKAGYEVTAIG